MGDQSDRTDQDQAQRERQHLAAMGLSTAAIDAHHAFVRGEATTADETVIAELREHKLLAPDALVPLPIRSATAAWTSEQRSRLAMLEGSAQMLSRSQNDHQDGSFIEVVSGLAQVREAFLQVQHSAEEVVRAVDRPPFLSGGDPEPSEAMDAVARRGVKFRTIYLSSLLQSPTIQEVIRVSSAHNEEARMDPDLAFRMILSDDKSALVILPQPSEPTTRVDGLLVYPSYLLDSLHRLFESTWHRALPINLDDPSDDEEVDRRILTLMSSGLTDTRIAASLGVSERTVARRVSRMQDRLGAPSRFLLGVRAARDNLV